MFEFKNQVRKRRVERGERKREREREREKEREKERERKRERERKKEREREKREQQIKKFHKKYYIQNSSQIQMCDSNMHWIYFIYRRAAYYNYCLHGFELLEF